MSPWSLPRWREVGNSGSHPSLRLLSISGARSENLPRIDELSLHFWTWCPLLQVSSSRRCRHPHQKGGDARQNPSRCLPRERSGAYGVRPVFARISSFHSGGVSGGWIIFRPYVRPRDCGRKKSSLVPEWISWWPVWLCHAVKLPSVTTGCRKHGLPSPRQSACGKSYLCVRCRPRVPRLLKRIVPGRRHSTGRIVPVILIPRKVSVRPWSC